MGNNNEEVKDLEVVEETKETVNDSPKTEEKPKEKKKPKDNKSPEVESWFIKVLKEEHKWETYLLGFISCFAMGIGALILSGVLVFKDGAPVFSTYADAIGWIFVAFGLLGFILFIIPIFRPTRKELKHLSLPSKNLFLGNVTRVFLFLIIMVSVFLLYDSVISAVRGVL